MISYNPKSWVEMILSFHKSDTLRILWKPMIYISILSSGLAWVELKYFPNFEKFQSLLSVYSLIGFVISLLLVFRTNTAYDRWWEGRKKWGQLVNDSRNLAVKISVLNLTQEERDFFNRMIANFALALKEHLRAGVKIEELNCSPEELSRLQIAAHVPNQLVQMLYERLNKLKADGLITDIEYLTIDQNLNSFLDISGACERIKSTPIPYSYSLFFKKFIFIYVITLPLAFVPSFGYYAAFIATFVFYVLVSLEILAEEIEDPFGADANDLDTDKIAATITRNVAELLG
jgi:ion channel-forming bestrophin family protein